MCSGYNGQCLINSQGFPKKATTKRIIIELNHFMSSYSVKVDEEEFQLQNTDLGALDIDHIKGSDFHVLKNNSAFNVRLIESNFESQKLSLSVNGNVYHVEINDENDQMVQQMGLLTNTSQDVQDVKAPMPGLIIEILVEPGQTVEEGTPLLILSAMKMENQILARDSGKIKAIAVSVGDAVEKSQLVIEME
ncbi:MAG TPA: biotin/lipoyl-binding protein [Pricia antarctica]|uniref:Biotin/lipoyl-binding protein n=2 Tax=root TaxID=1 RepID=A0A831VPD4_9FLAO|nr:biotin/lipoyl-binding protein [Pricia antarctica]